jgi:hypothetical protein
MVTANAPDTFTTTVVGAPGHPAAEVPVTV